MGCICSRLYFAGMQHNKLQIDFGRSATARSRRGLPTWLSFGVSDWTFRPGPWGSNLCQRRSAYSLTNHFRLAGHRAAATGSVFHRGCRRPIGPVADPDHENCHALLGVIRGHNRRTRLVGSPALCCVARDKKHQMRVPAHSAVI